MAAVKLKVSLYRRYFDTWARLVYIHPHGWQPDTAKLQDDVALENLEHLADRMNEVVPHLHDGGIDSLRAYATGCSTLLDDDESIDEPVRLHVKQLIAHLVWCLDKYPAVGDFDLQEAVERLFAAMVRTATTSDHRERWIDWLMNNTVWPFTVNLATAIPAQALIQLLGGA